MKTRYKALSLAVSFLVITGCATNYEEYAATQRYIAQQYAAVEMANADALKSAVNSGDSVTAVAAIMAMNNQGSQSAVMRPQIAAPTSGMDQVKWWVSALLPTVAHVYGINANKDIAINSSNNAAAIQMNQSNNMSGLGIAGLNAATGLGTAGLGATLGLGTSGLDATVGLGNAGLVTAKDIAEMITIPEPVIVNPVVVDPVVVDPVIVETEVLVTP